MDEQDATVPEPQAATSAYVLASTRTGLQRFILAGLQCVFSPTSRACLFGHVLFCTKVTVDTRSICRTSTINGSSEKGTMGAGGHTGWVGEVARMDSSEEAQALRIVCLALELWDVWMDGVVWLE